MKILIALVIVYVTPIFFSFKQMKNEKTAKLKKEYLLIFINW